MTAADMKPVAEFSVSTDAFVLAATLEAAPETIVEFEMLVPIEGDPLPHLWSTDTDTEAFEDAAVTDSTPREVTLEDVAEKLDISSKATSERRRRGQTNLISNTLTIGRPTGVGIEIGD